MQLNYFKKNLTPTFLCTLLLTVISFFFFSPLYNPEYNSDQAIYVLMSARFDWDYSAYYWGQNRLGSFFPLLCSLLLKIIPIAPLLLCSLVNQIMLFTTILITQGFLKSNWSKIVIAVVLLFPFYTFRAVLLLGHPYVAQLFLLSISLLILKQIHQRVIENTLLLNFKTALLLQIALCFFFLAIWVSETSAIIVLPIAINVLLYRNSYWNILKENYKKLNFIITLFVVIATICIGIWFYFYTKSIAEIDAVYDGMFIETSTQISTQFDNLTASIYKAFDASGAGVLFVIFNSLMIVFVLFQIVLFVVKLKNKKSLNKTVLIYNLTNIIFCIVLFFSVWNYTMNFAPRYYIINYFLFFVTTLMLLEDLKDKGKYLFNVFCSVNIFLLLATNYNHYNDTKEGFANKKKGAIEVVEYIQDGAILSDNYWAVHFINSYEPYRIIGIPESQTSIVRNKHEMFQFVEKQKFFYVTDTPPELNPIKDTLENYAYTLVRKKEGDNYFSPFYVYEYRLK